MKTTVIEIIDGDTFDVKPGWRWNDSKGNRVRPTGYNAPEINTQEGKKAKQKLERLINGKELELKKVKTIDRGRLVCDVYYQGKNLADYFPEYKL